MLTTKPILICPMLTPDQSYLALVEPDADGWTKGGVDHCSVAGGVATISGCGTDLDYYTRAVAAHAATAALWAEWDVQIVTGCVVASMELVSATMGKGVTITITGDATLVVAGTSVTQNMVAGEHTLRLLLTKYGWRLWIDDVFTASGTPSAEATNTRCGFGKNTSTSGSQAMMFSGVRYGVAGSWCFAWPPHKFISRLYETEKVVNVAWDGTTETVHARDDRFLTFTQQALSESDVTALALLYTTYLAPGVSCYLAEDYLNPNTAWHVVKWLDKRFDPQPDAAIPFLRQLVWRLREVAA